MDQLFKVLLSAGLLLCFASSGSGNTQCRGEDIWGRTVVYYCPKPGDDPDELFCCGYGGNGCCSIPGIDDESLEELFEKAPSPPQALAQVQPGAPKTTKQRVLAKLNDTMKATKNKMKTSISGKVAASKDKLKAKLNSTLANAKTKVKQKIKDKVKDKAKKKLDPTGGHLPTIIGVIGAIIVTLIILCIVCCCCCPFCLLYKRRNRGTVHNPNPEVSVMQPLQSQPHAYPPQQPAPYPPQPMQPPQQGYPPQAGYPPQPYPPAGYPSEQPPMYTEKQPPPYNTNY